MRPGQSVSTRLSWLKFNIHPSSDKSTVGSIAPIRFDTDSLKNDRESLRISKNRLTSLKMGAEQGIQANLYNSFQADWIWIPKKNTYIKSVCYRSTRPQPNVLEPMEIEANHKQATRRYWIGFGRGGAGAQRFRGHGDISALPSIDHLDSNQIRVVRIKFHG